MLVCHTAQCISIAEREAPVVCPHMMPRDNCANTKRSRPSQKRKSGALAGQGNHIIIFAEIDINSDNIWTMWAMVVPSFCASSWRWTRPRLHSQIYSFGNMRVWGRVRGPLSKMRADGINTDMMIPRTHKASMMTCSGRNS